MKEAAFKALSATVVEPVVVPVLPSEELTELLGKRIGNYVIERHLGIGGMAVVFVAKHPTLGREVAVKFLKPSLNADPQMAERFLHEAKVTATLCHPNVVEILDFGEYERRPYYMMELLQGEDLGATLREGRQVPFREVVAHVEQICEALDAAHKVGIVHRDLKPDNIFVVQRDPLKLKVMDFGVAKTAKEQRIGQTLHGQVLGTPTHMAPEQAMGHVDRITGHTDLYALGVIGYQMLTGRLPFVADSAMLLISMHIRDVAPPIRDFAPEVPPRIAELIQSCLAKDPAQRPRSARALATQLVAACRVAERGSTSTPVAKPSRERDNSVVEELAQRLARIEKARRNDADRFGIEVPKVQISDVPAQLPSDRPFDSVPVNGEGSGFESLPLGRARPHRAPEDRASSERTAPDAHSRDAHSRDAHSRDAHSHDAHSHDAQSGDQRPGSSEQVGAAVSVAASSAATLTPRVPSSKREDAQDFAATLVSSDGETPANVAPSDVRRDGDVIAARGAAARERAVVELEIERADQSVVRAPDSSSVATLRGGQLPKFQTGAVVLQSPEKAEPAEPSSRGFVFPADPRKSEARIEALRAEVRQRNQANEGLAFPAASEPVEIPPVAVPLLSEITDDPAVESVKFAPADGATLERLLQRMQRRGDFPSFLSNMTEIVTKADADGQFSATQLADALRKDFGLTARLLKVVNTAFMSRFKGRVYSVHHSVVILGFDSVRSIASSVLVYKVPGAGDAPAQGKHKVVDGKYNTRLAESAINSLVSGEIARLVANSAGLHMDAEIAMMAATFRNLGEHLVMQYLPEEFEQIEALMFKERLAFPVASERVLGMPLRKLGCGVMNRWQLPQVLCDAVASQTKPNQALEREIDRLGALARFSTDLADLVAKSGQANWGPSVQRLLERNRNLLSMDEREVSELMTTITKSFEDRFAALVGPYGAKSRFFSNARQLASAEPPVEDVGEAPPNGVTAEEPAGNPLDAIVAELEDGCQKRRDPEKLASKALQAASQLFGVPRVVLLGLSADKRLLEVRAGVGPEVENLKTLLKLPAGGQGSVFATVLNTNKPLCIEDALAAKSAKRVPQIYYEVIGSPCFAALPCYAVGYPTAVLLVDVNTPEHLPSEDAIAASKPLRAILVQLAHRLG